MAKQYGSNSPYPGDKINGKLEQGEYVMNRNVLAIPGMKEYLDKLNYEVAPRYARGGEVNGYALGGLAAWSKSLFDKFKARGAPTTAGDFDIQNMSPTAKAMATKDIATQALKKQPNSEADFQEWAGRPSDFAAGETAFNTSDEEDFQEGFGGPSITSKYMKEEATPDYMKDSLGSKLLSKFKNQDETVMDSPSEEELFFSQKYGSAPTPSEEPEAATAVDSDPHGIFKASEDYNPLAEEAPQKMGLKEALSGYGRQAGKAIAGGAGLVAGGAGLVAGGIGGAHKYLGAGKADKYEDVLTGKAKGSLYQRAGKGLGMLSSLASEFAAPGMGRGNLEGYGRYKGGETPTLKGVAPSDKVDSTTPVAENTKIDATEGPILGPEDEVGDYAKEMGLSREEAMEDVTDESIWGQEGQDDVADYAKEMGISLEEAKADIGNKSLWEQENLGPTPESYGGGFGDRDENLSKLQAGLKSLWDKLGFKKNDPRLTQPSGGYGATTGQGQVMRNQKGGLIGRAMGYQTGGEAEEKAHDNVDNEILKFRSPLLNSYEMTETDLRVLEHGMQRRDKEMGRTHMLVDYDDIGNMNSEDVRAKQELAGAINTHVQGETIRRAGTGQPTELRQYTRTKPERSVLGMYRYPGGGLQKTIDGIPMMDPINVYPEPITEHAVPPGYQEGGMISGNNSRRMFDFMKKRRY